MNATKTILALLSLLFGSVFALPVSSAQIDHPFPRKANYFLHWSLTESKARELAKWDLVILDMETQVNSKRLLQRMRQWNPNIVMLVYITPQEIVTNHNSAGSSLRKELGSRIDSRWYVTDSGGERLGWWPGTTLLNVSDHGPKVAGQSFQHMMADFVTDELLSTGLWDGVFYDNAWGDVRWAVGDDVDLNRDGSPDENPDQHWRNGLKTLYTLTREKTGNGYIIVGNGTSRSYQQELNGKMLENFIPGAWEPTMRTYAFYHEGPHDPVVNILNTNTLNTGNRHDYKMMRFGLTSALMEEGFYSFDHGDQNHGQLWWYDEYNADLGQPLAEAQARNGGDNYSRDVWTRPFENGIAVVNSTAQEKRVDLGGEYEKIHGTQDPEVNDGSIVSELEVSGADGQILLKTFSSLKGTLYPNGAFVRFFRPDGTRVRNGFFAFEDAYRGGEQIAHMDLNSDGKEDLLVVSGNKIEAWRHDGQPFLRVYPFTAAYRGKMQVALGDINGSRRMEIIVAPAFGENQALPIKVFTLDNLKFYKDWYPFGPTYAGGYDLAIGDVDFDPFGEILVSTGPGYEPKVYVYSHNLEEQSVFHAFERGFRGGVHIATGDFDNRRKHQIVVGRGEGGAPEIAVYDWQGNMISSRFKAYSAFGLPGIAVRTLDIDFDGKDDIVGVSESI